MSAAVAPEVEEQAEEPPKRVKRSYRGATVRMEVGLAVCGRVARGQLLKQACRAEGTNRPSFREWCEKDSELRQTYERARIEQAHSLAEDTIRIADADVGSMEAVQRNRLRVDTRKWYVSKLAPKLYGERIEHDHTHKVGVVLLPSLSNGVAGGTLEGNENKAIEGSTLTRARLIAGVVGDTIPSVVAACESVEDSQSSAMDVQGIDTPELSG